MVARLHWLYLLSHLELEVSEGTVRLSYYQLTPHPCTVVGTSTKWALRLVNIFTTFKILSLVLCVHFLHYRSSAHRSRVTVLQSQD